MSASTHGGKGDRQRKADTERFNNNYDAIFKEKKDDKKSKHEPTSENIGVGTTGNNNTEEQV